MKLIVNLKLKALEIQSNALLETLKEANKAANWISAQAFENKIFKQFNLHKLTYHAARQTFNLSAQVVVRVIAKVADAYKLDQKTPRKFRETGSIAYDDRIIRFKKNDIVSIWTVHGRMDIPFICGEHQRKLLPYLKGEVDLIYRKGQYFLNAVCDVPEESQIIPDDIIGVDFGITQIATSSDGEHFTGSEVERIRRKRFEQRQILQHKASKQTQNGKRPRSIHKLLKRLSGREKRFRQIENHRIAKNLVSLAKDTNRGIALENLTGIRKRVEKRFRKSQRPKVSGWSFYDLRSKVEYKAQLAGIPIYLVDPAYTSQTCSKCGHCEKANRKNQAEFECVSCHYSINADINAAKNIRGKAVVNLALKVGNIGLSKAVGLQA